MKNKLKKLSPELRDKISIGEIKYVPSLDTPITNSLVHTKRHCNGGATVESGLWLRGHCDNGGKIFLTMSGAGSSFQQGIMISELIRAGKIAAISVTGANLEESLYRLVANKNYAYIRDYLELTRKQEKELDYVGFRRITDTFLPEEESVRKLLPKFMKLWRNAQREGESYLWHEYFYQLFEQKLINYDSYPNAKDCWILEAWKHKIPIIVGGFEDSTMGNIFTHACYDGNHPFLSEHTLDKPIRMSVVKNSVAYMHSLAEWYMDNTKEKGLAFLQLGGGIAADFPICVVPHLKKDFLWNLSNKEQDKLIRSWSGFIEIHSSPMSFGSYSGAGFKEKITWGKFEVNAFGRQIFGDYTSIFPDIAAIVLHK